MIFSNFYDFSEEYHNLPKEEQELVMKTKNIAFYRRKYFRNILKNTEFLLRYGEQEGYSKDEMYDFVIQTVKNTLKTNLYTEYFAHIKDNSEGSVMEYRSYLDEFVFLERVFPFFEAETKTEIKRKINPLKSDIVCYFYELDKVANSIHDISNNGFLEHDDNISLVYLKDVDLYYIENGMNHLSVASILKEDKDFEADVTEYSLSDYYGKVDVKMASVYEDIYWYEEGNKMTKYLTDPRIALLYKLSEFKSKGYTGMEVRAWVDSMTI